MLICWERNIKTIKRNREALLDASKEVYVGVNTENIKYMFMSHHQNAVQNHSLKIANKSFDTVANSDIFGDNHNKSEFHSQRN
jgi:cytidine deaminase